MPEEPEISQPPPVEAVVGADVEPVEPVEPVPAFPGPDVAFGSYRRSLVWPALACGFGALSVFFFALILGPVAIVCGLVGVSRAERFSRVALAFAVAGFLAGLILHALTHNHHSLTTRNYYFN